MNDFEFDFIIIGSGIIGGMIARMLSQFQYRILLLEKEADIGMGTSSANSAIIHAGYDPKPGTLKARLNVRGNRAWDNVAGELFIPFRRQGSFVVAIGKDEFPILEDLKARGTENGVPGLKILSRQEMLSREPLLNSDVSGGLFAPTAGIIDPFQATFAVCENAVVNGVELLLDHQVNGFIREGNRIKGVSTNNGGYYSRWVINCAGIFADEIMHQAGIKKDFSITPQKGEYSVFDRSKFKISNVLFPVPTDKGKGILCATTVHGNTIIGPNSGPARDKADTSTTAEGLDEVYRGASKLLPHLKMPDIIAQYAGLRAKGNTGDFIIEESGEIKGLVNVAGIDSPGFASSPAIAEMVLEILKEAGEKPELRRDYNPVRIPRPHFKNLSHEERSLLVASEPAYGRIVCRCEEITEGELLAEMHAPIPAKTYDALKRRTWLGTGRCQGSFDYPRVFELLSREWNIPMTAVSKKGKGSEFLVRETKAQ